jgi:hypothetical protein
MGVYVDVKAEINSADNSKKTNVDLSGLSYSKWEHPLLGLFGGIVEKYDFLKQFYCSTVLEEDLLFLKINEDEEEGIYECTNWMCSTEFYSIISKFDSQKVIDISSKFENNDDNGRIQFLTCFSKLQALADIEKMQNSKIQITFIYS